MRLGNCRFENIILNSGDHHWTLADGRHYDVGIQPPEPFRLQPMAPAALLHKAATLILALLVLRL